MMDLLKVVTVATVRPVDMVLATCEYLELG